MRTQASKRLSKWTILAQTVRGAIHCRRGEPNQDAIETFSVAGSRPPLIVAVSDGHGSSKSFRSDRGAQFGVEIAVDEAKRLITDLPDSLEAVRSDAESHFPAALVRAWTDRVLRDITANPFTVKERRNFTSLYGALAWKSLRQNPLLAYGATLLLAVATRSFLLLAQIGDGDIVTVSAAGCASRPLIADPRLFGGETTSLCLPDAVASFAVSVCAMKGERSALVLLSTDGYSNSYANDEGFLRVGSDILAMVKEDGPECVQHDLANWLEEASKYGSGDDVTLGVLCLL